MSRVLVTGANSFTGGHLLPLLAADPSMERIAGIGIGGRPSAGIPFEEVDLRDREAVRHAVEKAAPDLVFHLAGVSSPDADVCFGVNLDGTRNLVEACVRLARPPKVLIVSSSAVYGQTRPEESPVKESVPLRPIGAYGASKAAAEIHALSMHRRGLLRVVVARPFNLIGPGLPRGLAPADFMGQALAIGRGEIPAEARVGHLEPRRDFVDARDAARAYVLIASREAAFGEAFNVATGRAVSIRRLVELTHAAAGIQPRIVEDPARRRPVDVMQQVGDISALAALTGWKPEIPLEASLADMAAAG